MFKFFKCISFILVLIGGLNWGLVGTFNFDLVGFLFGEMSVVARIIYTLVGLCAIITPIMFYQSRNECTCQIDK